MSSSLHGATACERYTMPGMLPMVVRRRRSLSACASSASCRPVTSIRRPIISAGTTVNSGHEHGPVEHPPHLAAGRDDAVLRLGVGGPGVDVAVQLPDDPVQVVGMHDVRPGPVAVRELRGVVTEQRPEPLAQERRVPRFVEVAAVGRAGQALTSPPTICSRSRSASSVRRSSVMSLTKPSR